MTITSISVVVQTNKGDVTVFLTPEKNMDVCARAAEIALRWIKQQDRQADVIHRMEEVFPDL